MLKLECLHPMETVGVDPKEVCNSNNYCIFQKDITSFFFQLALPCANL